MNTPDLWNGQFSFKKQPTSYPVYVGKILEINKLFVEFAFGVLLVLKKTPNLFKLPGDGVAFPCTGQNLWFCDHCPSVGGKGSSWWLPCAPFLTGVTC